MVALDYATKWITAVEVLSEVFRVDGKTVERLLQSMTEEEREVLVQECGRPGPAPAHHWLEHNTVAYQAYLRAIARFTDVAQETFMREERVR
jgi:hypothetical protein